MNNATRPMQPPIVKDLPATAALVSRIPKDTVLPDFSKLSGFTGEYIFRDASGAIAFVIHRFERPDPNKLGKKQKVFLPLTMWYCPKQGYIFARKGHPESLLFNLWDLRCRFDDTVIISEGEKCAVTVAKAFPSYVSVTWPGGSNAVGKPDWTALVGRNVMIFPDHDEAGRKACAALIEKLSQIGVASIRVLDIEATGRLLGRHPIESGYDIHDAVTQDGLDAHKLEALLAEHPEILTEVYSNKDKAVGDLHQGGENNPVDEDPIVEIKRATGFDLNFPDHLMCDAAGIYAEISDRRGQISHQRICSPIFVLGRTKTDETGPGWGSLLTYKTPENTWENVVIPAEMFAGDGREVRVQLARRGVSLPASPSLRLAFAEYLLAVDTGTIITVAGKVGWNGDAYLLPDQVFSPPGSTRRVMLDTQTRLRRLVKSGSMEGWRQLAELARGNTRATFAICSALAAVLLGLIGEEGCMFHFHGRSSRGKTTLLRIAASLWSNGDHVGSWRATTNGIEGVAAEHNDMPLFLDEIGQVDPDHLLETVFMLMNGVGKSRAGKSGEALTANTWRTLVLSSGEVTSAAHLRAGKLGATGKLPGGFAVRVIDIAIETRSDGGPVYECLHGHRNEAALAETLARIAQEHHGHAGPAFVAALIEELDHARARAKELLADFTQEVLHEGDDAQVGRVARHFGVVMAAGVLAAEFGILPIPAAEIREATSACYETWYDSRGNKSEEERDGLQVLKTFFELHGPARFQNIDGSDDEPVLMSDRLIHTRCGYRQEMKDENGDPYTVYFVLPEAWRTQICAGRNPDIVARVALQHGALLQGEGGRLRLKKRLPDYPQGTRVYAILPDRLP